METTRSKYNLLLEDVQLYETALSRDLINNTTLSTLLLTGFEKERWLRHAKVCMLLCNTKIRKEEPFQEGPKRQKLDQPSTSATTSSSASSSDSDHKNFQFVCIEIEFSPGNFQRDLAETYRVENPSSTFDIFDTEAKQFIEVKVSANANARLRDFQDKWGPDWIKYGFVVADPTDGGVQTWNLKSEMTGVSKVHQFLILRVYKMTELGLNVNTIDVQEDLVGEVMVSQFLNGLKKEFMDDLLLDIKEPVDSEEHKFLYMEMNPRVLLARIANPMEREAPPILWKGKLTPFFLLHTIETEVKEDKYMITEVINKMKQDVKNHWINAVIDNWDYDRSSNFELYKEKNRRLIPEALRKRLGIGEKQVTKNVLDDSTQQPEYGAPENKKYHLWFENLLYDFSKPSTFKTNWRKLRVNLGTQPQNVTDRVASECFNTIVEHYAGTNIAAHVSYNINLYSRLSGSYAPKGSLSTNQSNVVIMPLYCKTDDELGGKRLVSGFCIRAPQHARNSHDKVNLIIVEMVKRDRRTREYLKYMTKPEVIMGTDCDWMIRQQAIEKADSAYLVFLENALFVPCNFIGEIILNFSMKDERHLKKVSGEIIEYHKDWIVERIVESVVIALTSRAMDEGAFAMVRKFFMVMMCFKRGDSVGCIDVNGFCEKFNECLVDNAMGMYYAKQIRDVFKNILIPRFQS